MTGVPKQTIRDHVCGRVAEDASLGGPPLFTQEEEKKLAQHVVTMASFGYGYGRMQLVYLASDMASFAKKCVSTKTLSNKWFYGFIKRWPELKLMKPRKLSMTRAQATTKETITSYFEELKGVINKYDLTHRPEAIYNIDETGFSPEHTPPKVSRLLH